MTQITLNSEQAAILANAGESIYVRMPDGTFAGLLRLAKEPLFTPEEIAEAERRAQSPGPYFTTKEVLAYLDSLDKK